MSIPEMLHPELFNPKNTFGIMQMLENYLFFDSLNAISIIERVYVYSQPYA
jgi:hypothetical protein